MSSFLAHPARLIGGSELRITEPMRTALRILLISAVLIVAGVLVW